MKYIWSCLFLLQVADPFQILFVSQINCLSPDKIYPFLHITTADKPFDVILINAFGLIKLEQFLLTAKRHYVFTINKNIII